jgi:methylated-DNA-[protein]-cysteine S-methyltransferase
MESPIQKEMTCMHFETTTLDSLVGTLHLFAQANALTHVFMQEHVQTFPNAIKKETAILTQAKTQLAEYFSGARTDFNLNLAPTGTEFQKQVWNQLSLIPFGATWSYSELAKAIHNPKAVRAVGGANRVNPLSIIVPCHRVIGMNGTLTGYGGGLKAKQWLLQFEDAACSQMKKERPLSAPLFELKRQSMSKTYSTNIDS